MRLLRLSLLFLVTGVLLGALASPPARAATIVQSIGASTDRMEYINVTGYDTVNATAVVFFSGTLSQLSPVRFLWYGPGGVELLRERFVTLVPRGPNEAVAEDAWTADRTGLSLSVHAGINRTGGPAGGLLWSNVTFPMHDPAGWSLVTGLALRAPAESYQGSPVTATVQLLWVGSGPLGDVQVVWADANGTEVRNETVASLPDGTAASTWTPNRQGWFRVTATYLGADPSPASTDVNVLPESARPNSRPPLNALLLTAFAAIVGLSLAGLAVVRRRAVGPGGAAAAATRRRMPTTLEPGGSYVLTEADPSRAYGVFASYVNAGAKGLVLSRLYPDEIRARHPVGSSTVLWLSRGYGRAAVNPTNLSRMVDAIERHIAGREASVVLLDDADYLVTQNGAQVVARFLERLTDAVSAHHSRLLVPLDPASLAPDTLAVLTRDLRKL